MEAISTEMEIITINNNVIFTTLIWSPQRGLQRARSRSSGREKERSKRASSALHGEKSHDEENMKGMVDILNDHDSWCWLDDCGFLKPFFLKARMSAETKGFTVCYCLTRADFPLTLDPVSSVCSSFDLLWMLSQLWYKIRRHIVWPM